MLIFIKIINMALKKVNVCEAYDIVEFAEKNGYVNAHHTLENYIYRGDPKESIVLEEVESIDEKKVVDSAKPAYEILRKFCEKHNLKGKLVICRDIVEK